MRVSDGNGGGDSKPRMRLAYEISFERRPERVLGRSLVHPFGGPAILERFDRRLDCWVLDPQPYPLEHGPRLTPSRVKTRIGISRGYEDGELTGTPSSEPFGNPSGRVAWLLAAITSTQNHIWENLQEGAEEVSLGGFGPSTDYGIDLRHEAMQAVKTLAALWLELRKHRFDQERWIRDHLS